jgi:hypothetical protein
MTLFTLPLVSYGSDKAPIENPNEGYFKVDQVISFENNMSSIETITIVSVDHTVFNYLIDTSTDFCTSTLLITQVCKSGAVPTDDTGSTNKPNFYKDQILSTPKTPDTLDSIDSQHVGKLMGFEINTIYSNFSLFKFAPPSME